MTADEIIDAVAAYVYDVNEDDPDNVERRARLLQYLQEVYDEVWLFREWAFTYRTATTTITGTNGTADLPADYLELGVQGKIFDQDGRELLEDTYPDIRQAQLRGHIENPPCRFAIFSLDTDGNKILTPLTGTNYTIDLLYRCLPETLADDVSPTVKIPASHHNTVLVMGTAAKAARSVGDPRPDWESAYRAGLQRMIIVERSRKTSIQRLPRAISGMW